MSKRSDTNGWTRASPSMLKRAVRLVKTAGATSEDASKRNGFLSWHAETHAAGMGIAAGFFAFAQGEMKLLSMVYGAAVYGNAHARNGTRKRLLNDIVSEPHYALAGIVVGALLGLLSRLLLNFLGLEVGDIVEAVGWSLNAVVSGGVV